MPSASASVVELADDWLTAKRALESAAQAEKGHSDRARRADLERWSVVLGEVRGRSPAPDQAPMASLMLSDLSAEVLVGAMAAAKRRWSDATVARMLSTLRGFTRWLHRAGHLATDPLDGDLFRAPARPERRPKAPDTEDLERMLSAAQEASSSRQRMFWPTRDAALLRFLATTGARAEEACGVTIGELDRRAERPIWRVGRAKGGKARDVPLPRTTLDAIDDWLAERVRPDEGRRALKARRADPLFVRPNGTPLSPQALDRVVRGLAHRAGVVLPEGAAAHAFRHHYGVTLALRGVPQAVISQLMGHADPRTTAIYTTVASTQLIAALDDAGLLD
ncbi:MAG TPA: tyrosine-type recombinase/integrase [Acidimicrobiales bacterium]|nr:tyrosine-type recombinase/integrase [Acidimicrobiales bacterium]